MAGKTLLSPEEFTVMWNASRSIQDFIARTGMREPTAYSRAAAYRKKGIKLKYMSDALHTVERLNEVKRLAEETIDIWDVDNILKQYVRKS